MLPKSVLIATLVTTLIGLANSNAGETTNPVDDGSYDDDDDGKDDSGSGNSSQETGINGLLRSDEGVVNCMAGKCTLPLLENSKHPPTGMVLILSAYYLLISDFRFWLSNVCARNKLLHKSKRMKDLVLWDIAVQTTDPTGCDTGPNYTLLTFALDVVAPWFPGGTESCFERLWVGTVELSCKTDWVTKPKYVANSLAWSMEIGAAFKARYPTTEFNWFITHNTNIDDLSSTTVASAYKAYMTKLVRTT